MNAFFLLVLLAGGALSAPADGEIRLTIARDPYTSSDQVTLCRVRAVNDGSRTWPGRLLRFEARAVDTTPMVRERGRFGLELAPHGTLETLVALPGRHDRFEVELLSAATSDDSPRHPRAHARSRRKAARPR